MTIDPSVIAVASSLLGTLVGGGITYFLNKQLHEHQIEILHTQYKTDFMAEQTALHFLNHKKFTDRTFDALENHLGGFKDDELRKILVRAGAVRVKREGDDKEYWRLLSRMDEYIEKKNQWYYSAAGKSQALDYFNDLDQKQQIKLLKLAKHMGDVGEIKNKEKFRNEGDKIFAFKPQPDRFLCFFTDGSKIVITNAFVKKQDKLPQGEKDRALRCMADFQERVKKGTYYDD